MDFFLIAVITGAVVKCIDKFSILTSFAPEGPGEGGTGGGLGSQKLGNMKNP